MATTNSSPPEWMDFFNDWYTNEYTPWAYAAGGNPYELSRWNTDPDAARQKLVLDKQYTDALAAYNQQQGTNIAPDTSVLGVNAQPNMWWRVPDSGGGLFGSIGDVFTGAVNTVGDVVGGAADFATEHPLETALLAAGVYYAPEIGAYLSSDGAVVGTTAEQAAANTGAVELGTTSGAAWDAATSGAYGGPVAGAAAALGATGAGLGAGLTASEVIKALPLVPIVNQIAGDPLGLNKTETPAASGTTGFQMVPIPAEWKQPTYQANQAPIDLNSIFTDQNLLAGTQWQGLPNQRNMTFNDIFSAGQQSTPMGTPVNINNLVSEILGQTSTSQKST